MAFPGISVSESMVVGQFEETLPQGLEPGAPFCGMGVFPNTAAEFVVVDAAVP